MNNSVCAKVISMLSAYIDHKLSETDKAFVEFHLYKCSSCYQKYMEMKKAAKNLRFEYEKMRAELENTDTNNTFAIREHENFYNNIAAYVDDELCYDEGIKFRKYLLKSKAARRELAIAYALRNGIKDSFSDYKSKINVNYSKKITDKLKNENKTQFEKMYSKALMVSAVMVICLIIISLFITFGTTGKSYAKTPHPPVKHEVFNFPDEKNMYEFYFDENNDAVLTEK